jgi:hypothetical protein
MKHRQQPKRTAKMPNRCKIEKCKREIAAYLSELDEADDLDLWEEAAAKLCDVLVVYRRSQERELISFTDDQLREMSAWPVSVTAAELVFREAINDFQLATVQDSRWFGGEGGA